MIAFLYLYIICTEPHPRPLMWVLAVLIAWDSSKDL